MHKRLTILLWLVAAQAAFGLTTITDTLYSASGKLVNGSATIKWAQFTAAGPRTIAAGTLVVSIRNGAFTVALEPGDTAQPEVIDYTVQIRLSDGVQWLETWRVPTSETPVTVASVRLSTVLIPASMLALTQLSPVGSAKGDLIAFGTSWGLFSGGNDGQALVRDSSQARGLRWADSITSRAGDLLDCKVTVSGAIATVEAPCKFAIGGAIFSITADATATLSGASTNGTVYFYWGSSGQLIADENSEATLTCNASCTTAETGGFPSSAFKVASASFTSTSYDVEGVTDQRAFLSTKNVECGSGLTCAESGGITEVSNDGSLLTKAGAQSGGSLACAGASGTDSYTCTMTPALTGYTDHMVVQFEPDVNNTGAASLSIDGLGAIDIKKVDGSTDPADDDLVAGRQIPLSYDGTAFRLGGGGAVAHASTHAVAGDDAVTLAESQITNLVTDLSGKAATVHSHTLAGDATGDSGSTVVGQMSGPNDAYVKGWKRTGGGPYHAYWDVRPPASDDYTWMRFLDQAGNQTGASIRWPTGGAAGPLSLWGFTLMDVPATKSLTLFDPVTDDSGRVQFVFAQAVTITRVACSVKAATSVSINLDERAAATPDTPGTDVLSAALVCDTDQQAACASGCDVNTITNGGIAARVPVALTISAVGGTPDTLRVHMEYTPQ